VSGQVGAQHVRELAARKSKAYELLLSLEQNPSADDACFESLARVVDRVVFNEISIDGAVLRNLSAFVSEPAEDLSSTLAVLDVALSEGEPERANLQVLLSGFPGWLKSASQGARSHVLSILPNIAAHLRDVGESGVESLIACFNAFSSVEDRDAVARSIVRYQETSGDIILASAQIASLLLRTGAASMIERMLIAVPPEEMFESKDARGVLPAIAKLRGAPGGDEVWSAAAAVCLSAAKQNHSSALNLAHELGKPLAQLADEMRVPYLKAFQSIVEEAGISLIGYGVKELPAVLQKAGTSRASAFVAEGVAIAHRYGKVAAQEFFEQKTSASRQAASRQMERPV
jgi:hypothetical protein